MIASVPAAGCRPASGRAADARSGGRVSRPGQRRRSFSHLVRRQPDRLPPILRRHPASQRSAERGEGRLSAGPDGQPGWQRERRCPHEVPVGGRRLRFNLCRQEMCPADPCSPCSAGGCRTDFLVGYRFLRLDDGLGIREELTSTDPELSGAFLVQDTFGTRNQFNGGEFGFVHQTQWGRWSLEFLPKIAFGVTREAVSIAGSTRTTEADGTRHTDSGGLLALQPNIGHYVRNEFAVVPEVDLTVGFQWTPRLRSTLGYTFIYWSRVARAGDQIDLKVNPTLLPNGGPPEGDLTHPMFAFHEAGYWAQGLNFGLDYRW